MHRLSDELLKAVFEQLLLIADDALLDTANSSPFHTGHSRSSQVLLVCKRWGRVGTPILYRTVVISRASQAQAIKTALSRRPDLGRHTTRLRLEGAFGDCLAALAPCMSGVKDFCFTLSAGEGDDISEWALALRSFNPTRAALTMARGFTHDTRDDLSSHVYWAIRHWTKLVRNVKSSFARAMLTVCQRTFRFADCHPRSRTSEFIDYAYFTDALVEHPYIETVYVAARWNWTSVPRERLKALLANPSIQRVVLRGHESEEPHRSFLLDMPFSMTSRMYFLPYGDSGPPRKLGLGSIAEPSSNPQFRPMERFSSEARIDVWKEVFEYAITRPADEAPSFQAPHGAHPLWFDAKGLSMRTVRTLLFVSQEFRVRLNFFFRRCSLLCRRRSFAFCSATSTSKTPKRGRASGPSFPARHTSGGPSEHSVSLQRVTSGTGPT